MKRTPLKKKSTKPTKIKSSKLDELWSKAVRLLAGGKCEYCGSTFYLNAHHIFSRSNHGLRWNLENGICLCTKHHTFSREFSAHMTPMEFAEWVMSIRGDEWYANLKMYKFSVTMIDQLDLPGIKRELEEIIERYK